MAISVQQILEEERLKAQRPIQAPVATPEQAVSENQGTVYPEVTERQLYSHMDQRVGDALTKRRNSPQQVIYDNKPEGWDDQQYEAVRSLGYTDEQIAQAFSNPDPDQLMTGIFSAIYKNSVPKPQAPDEKTMKRQRNIAGIGDILSLLAQSAGSAMGARTRERGWEESASARLTAKQKEIYDKYLNDSDKYNRELVNAQIQDYLQGKQDWMQTRSNIQEALKYVNEQRIKQAEKEQKDAIEREKLDISKQNAESMRLKREHDMKIAEQNAATLSAYRQSQINRNNAETSRKASSLSGKKADITFYLNSEKGDPNAQVDQFGRAIVEYNLSKDEVFSLAQEAKKDREFLKRNGLILSQPDALGNGSWRFAPDDEIALAYVQEMYSKQYQQAKQGQAQYPQIATPKPKWDESQDWWQDPLDTPSYEQQKSEETDEWDIYLID